MKRTRNTAQYAQRRRMSKPFCLCGCRRRVKCWHNRYFSTSCITSEQRAEFCRMGRRTFAYRKRAEKFHSELARLGRTFNREDLLVCFQRLYRSGYESGYNAGRFNRQKAIKEVA